MNILRVLSSCLEFEIQCICLVLDSNTFSPFLLKSGAYKFTLFCLEMSDCNLIVHVTFSTGGFVTPV